MPFIGIMNSATSLGVGISRLYAAQTGLAVSCCFQGALKSFTGEAQRRSAEGEKMALGTNKKMRGITFWCLIRLTVFAYNHLSMPARW
jgi:hypothetical protein